MIRVLEAVQLVSSARALFTADSNGGICCERISLVLTADARRGCGGLFRHSAEEGNSTSNAAAEIVPALHSREHKSADGPGRRRSI